MKHLLSFLFLFCFMSLSAQKLPHYDKINKIMWVTDTLFAITDNPPLNIADIEVYLSPITYSCTIYFTNNSDQPIEVNWSRVIIKNDGNSIMTRLRKAVLIDEQQQIQKVPKKGKVWQSFEAI